ncbi:MAG: hypothetical protein H6Q72_4845 [Firmicutes bacterium]|nr:hypothetical protein [Bacillota bacterium]
MATKEQEDKMREELYSRLVKLQEIDIEKLIRTQELGVELSFESGRPYFERILSLFKTLAESNLDIVPFTTMHSINEIAKEVLQYFDAVVNFKIAGVAEPLNSRNALVNWFMENYDRCFTIISPVTAFTIRKGTDFDRLEREARGSLEQLKTVTREAQESIQKSQQDAHETLEKIRQTAAQTGVAHHAKNFEKQYQEHETQSLKWLKVTVALGIATALWGYVGFQFETPPDDVQAKIIYLTKTFASRITVFSVLIYMLMWSGKNYAAHQHNVVINKHRHNALITFETFVKAAGGDIDTKNAVLLQATNSIFSAQQTGYINKDSEKDQSNKVIEIMRSAGSVVNKG